MTRSAAVRVQCLSYTQMLSRAINRTRIRIEARKIVRKRDDVVFMAEGRMQRALWPLSAPADRQERERCANLVSKNHVETSVMKTDSQSQKDVIDELA